MKNYIEIEVVTTVEGCRFTSKRKISMGAAEVANTKLEDLIIREASDGAKLGARQAFANAKRRGGFGRDPKEIEEEIKKRFKEKIPNFELDLYIDSDKIVFTKIFHDDWFINGVGANPKYVEISGKFGDTRYTFSYRYFKGSEWVYLHQGSVYYENNFTPMTPPFSHDDVMKFIDELRAEGYNVKLEPIYTEEEPQPAEGE